MCRQVYLIWNKFGRISVIFELNMDDTGVYDVHEERINDNCGEQQNVDPTNEADFVIEV